VVPVETRGDLRRFLLLPRRLYRGDPCFVPPLLADRRAVLDPERNPFFRRAERRLWLAVRGGTVVGRVAGIVNRAHNEFRGDRTGFFGFYEAQDDPEIARALLAEVESAHRGAGLDRLCGPVNPSMGSECGLLVEGFDSPPSILMPYNPPRYASHFEGFGLRKEMDLLAYRFGSGKVADLEEIRERIGRLAQLARRRHPGLATRRLDPGHLRRDAFLLRDVFDGARRQNYGFVPSTDEEYDHLVGQMKRIFDPDLVQFLELGGETVGCVVALPDWNVALRRSAGWPGPLRLLRILAERRRIRHARVIAIALAPGTRRSGLMAVLVDRILEEGLRKGYESAELSWVAENNTVQVKTLEGIVGAGPFKRYRIYAKPIDPRAAGAGREVGTSG
jgi:hypothetical protein